MLTSAQAKDAAEDRYRAGVKARADAAPKITLSVWVSLVTGNAAKITRKDKTEVWVPNSLLEAVPNTGQQTITLPEWKAKQEGLI